MAINKKLIHFKSKENFEKEVANENILDTSICFILDSKEISTHGTVYKTVNWSILEEKDPFNGHEYVDLGLPSGTLWATSVIGGDNPLYFQWGDIEGWTAEQINNGEKAFASDSSDYKWNEGIWDESGLSMTKYNITDGKTVLDLEDDAAHVHMGGGWHIPTREQLYELKVFVPFTWTTQNGVSGMLFTSMINGKSIFVPTFGCAYNSSLRNNGSYSCIWGSSVYKGGLGSAEGLISVSNGVDITITARFLGLCVLGVINPKS